MNKERFMKLSKIEKIKVIKHILQGRIKWEKSK